MKKILLLLVFIFTLFWNSLLVNSNCSYDWDIWDGLSNCFKNTDLVWTSLSEKLKVDWKWFQDKIKSWRNTLAIYLWIASVFWLAFSWFTFATSAWEEEKINKAKSIAKWTVIWFLTIIFASTIIIVIVKLFYSI